jgi:hypothetical protein
MNLFCDIFLWIFGSIFDDLINKGFLLKRWQVPWHRLPFIMFIDNEAVSLLNHIIWNKSRFSVICACSTQSFVPSQTHFIKTDSSDFQQHLQMPFLIFGLKNCHLQEWLVKTIGNCELDLKLALEKLLSDGRFDLSGVPSRYSYNLP